MVEAIGGLIAVLAIAATGHGGTGVVGFAEETNIDNRVRIIDVFGIENADMPQQISDEGAHGELNRPRPSASP